LAGKEQRELFLQDRLVDLQKSLLRVLFLLQLDNCPSGTMKILVNASWSLVGFLVAFFSYGTGRTMLEHVGFTWDGVFYGAFITLIFITIVLSVLLAIFKLLVKPFTVPLVLVTFGAIVGGLSAEVAVLKDEVTFLREAESADRLGRDERLSRSRAWPHSSGSLLWDKERGVWSTD
jgi:hypothetical protein